MKLKTLKDLKWLRYTTKIRLKAEAIRIIKVLNSNYYSLIKAFPFKILNSREVILLIDFVKWQNNITEEDLK